jgi:hypothetical protein
LAELLGAAFGGGTVGTAPIAGIGPFRLAIIAASTGVAARQTGGDPDRRTYD